MKQFAFMLLPIATLFLLLALSRAKSSGLCERTTHKRLCKELVKSNEDPTTATQDVLRRLLKKTKHAKSKAEGNGKNGSICKEAYDDAMETLTRAMDYFKNHDRRNFKTYVSAASGYYSSCDDSYEERGKVCPLSKLNSEMSNIVETILELYKLVP